VKFLIDECLRPLVAAGLRDVGHDAIHVGDVGLLGATDEQVMALVSVKTRRIGQGYPESARHHRSGKHSSKCGRPLV